MKTETRRADIDFLLEANPLDYDMYSAAEAVCILQDSLDDIEFQRNDVPVHKFKGNREEWIQRVSYKRNKIRSAERRFRFRFWQLAALKKEGGDLSLQ